MGNTPYLELVSAFPLGQQPSSVKPMISGLRDVVVGKNRRAITGLSQCKQIYLLVGQASRLSLLQGGLSGPPHKNTISTLIGMHPR